MKHFTDITLLFWQITFVLVEFCMVLNTVFLSLHPLDKFIFSNLHSMQHGSILTFHGSEFITQDLISEMSLWRSKRPLPSHKHKSIKSQIHSMYVAWEILWSFIWANMRSKFAFVKYKQNQILGIIWLIIRN